MPALQNLVLTDRATPTPVNHTFTPDGKSGDVASVREDNGVPYGSPRVTISKRVTASRRHKAVVQYAFPTIISETVNGQPVDRVARMANIDLTVTFDERSTEQERKNAIGMLQSSLDPTKALVNDTLIKLQGVY